MENETNKHSEEEKAPVTEIIPIIQEEIIRDEVRKVLNVTKREETFNKKVFEFFNSALGIFILSTVFISFGSFLFSLVSSRLESRRQETEAIYKITNELNYRCQVLKEMNKMDFWEKEYFGVVSAYYGFEGTRNTNDYYVFRPVYKEFEHRSFNALLIELSYISGKENIYLAEVEKKLKRFERKMSTAPRQEGDLRFFRMGKNDSIAYETEIIVPIELRQVNLKN